MSRFRGFGTLPYIPRAIVLVVHKAGLLTRSRSNCLPVGASLDSGGVCSAFSEAHSYGLSP